jgi:uncharacterized alkaline shock family protein YloU
VPPEYRVIFATIPVAFTKSHHTISPGLEQIHMTTETQLGKIEISPTAIASIASQAVLESYGVVGMASKNFKNGLVELLTPRASHRGVDVNLADEQIIIDLYVVIEYGTRISEVAHNIMAAVKFRVEKALGIPVTQVNVHVQGLRVSNKD